MLPATYGESSPPTAARVASSTSASPCSTCVWNTRIAPSSARPNASMSRSPSRAPISWTTPACRSASSNSPRSNDDRTRQSSSHPRSLHSGSSASRREARCSHPLETAPSCRSACSSASRSPTRAASRPLPSAEKEANARPNASMLSLGCALHQADSARRSRSSPLRPCSSRARNASYACCHACASSACRARSRVSVSVNAGSSRPDDGTRSIATSTRALHCRTSFGREGGSRWATDRAGTTRSRVRPSC